MFGFDPPTRCSLHIGDGHAAVKKLIQIIIIVMVVPQQARHVLAEEFLHAVFVVVAHGQMWSQRHICAFRQCEPMIPGEATCVLDVGCVPEYEIVVFESIDARRVTDAFYISVPTPKSRRNVWVWIGLLRAHEVLAWRAAAGVGVAAVLSAPVP